MRYWSPYIIMFSIFASSFLSDFGGTALNISHITILLITLFYTPKIISFLSKRKVFLLFILYIFLHAFTELFFVNSTENVITIIRRLILFYSCFSVMPIMIIFFSSPATSKKLDKFLISVIIIATVFAFYQLVARQFGLPFAVLEHNRFRTYGLTQATSFFREPRFFAFFINTCIYILLFIHKLKYNKLLLTMLLLSSLLTISITSYVLTFLLLLMYIFQSRSVKTRSKFHILYKKSKIPIAFTLLAIIFVVNYGFKIGNPVRSRLYDAFISSKLSDTLRYALEHKPSHTVDKKLPKDIAIQGSLYYSTFGELSFIIYTLRDSPLFGYGIGYDKYELERTMGLNAFAEFMVRWGLIGVLLFILLFFWRRNTVTVSNRYTYFIFFLLFCFSNGSIAKPLFWFLLFLLYIYKNLYLVRQKVMKDQLSRNMTSLNVSH